MSEQQSLEEKFLEVDGVGEKTTEQLLDIVNQHEFTRSRLMQKAIDAAEDGDDRTASVYLRRASR